MTASREAGRRRKRLVRRIAVLLALLLAGAGGMLALACRIYLAGHDDERGPADVIVVLGAAQYDGQPSNMLRGRLDHALTLYRAGYAPRLLFTGGRRPADRYTEAMAGARYARAHGVPARAILLEPQGRTTLESMRAARAIMAARGLRRAILVSDPYHAFRLRRMARDLGIDARVSPTPHSAVRSLSKQGYYISREVVVYLAYRLAGV